MLSLKHLSLCAAFALVAGCSQNSAPADSGSTDVTTTVNGETVPLTAFEDIPAAQNTSLNVNDSLIISQGEDWLGRLVLSSKMNNADAFTYYRENMPKMGWQQVAQVQGKNAVMTFIKPKRVATLQFEASSLTGSSTIRITVSPHNLSPGQ